MLRTERRALRRLVAAWRAFRLWMACPESDSGEHELVFVFDCAPPGVGLSLTCLRCLRRSSGVVVSPLVRRLR